jgi:ATP-dependent Clp protease ATP-binding subunit ClpA/protein subunit release factor A
VALFDAALRNCSDDLADVARRGDAPLVIGREAEARALAELLLARKSVLLVGEAGVGKSAVVHRLLADVEAGHIAGDASGLRLYRTSTSRLISETKYLGEWQSKLTSVVRDLVAEEFAVLYLTDVWNLTSVGRSESTDETMADLLKDYIESGRIAVLGEVTKAQVAAYLDRMPSFRNAFVQLRVDPIPAENVRPILASVAGHLASRRDVLFDETALDRAVELTDRFLPYRHQPGKAIELFERTVHLAGERERAGRLEEVTAHTVEEAFSEVTGLPLFIVSDREQVRSSEIRAFFRERVLGQDHALDRIVETIALYKAGLNDPSRPIGTFLFVGPTGVGKTELAKALAEFLFGGESRMLRFDMSEYKDYHSFEKLIGDPKRPGSSGVLVDAMRAHAFAVVLLDEFEKSHPNIADLFLQVFDDGRLTDAHGQTVDFRNTIIILTSNVGTDARVHGRPITGFGDGPATSDDDAEARIRRALEEAFRPEFLNRIEHVVVFRPLTREIVRRIALKEIGRVYGRRGISSRRIAVEVDDRLLDRVLDRGFNPRYGARALKREISREIVVPLAVALMENPIEPGQVLRIEPKGIDEVAVRILETDESRRARAVDEEVDVEGRRLSLAEVEQGTKTLAARLADVAARFDAAAARERLDAMRGAQQEPGFWSDQQEALSSFERYNRLAGELRRLDEIGDRLAKLRERAAGALRQKDAGAREALARDFLRAELALDRLEVELTAFGECDDCPALVTVRVQGAGPHDAAWLAQLTKLYLEWAGAVRRPAELLYEPLPADGSGEPLVVLRVDGPFAFGYLKGEAGAHRLRDEEHGPDGLRTVSAVATVEVAPLSEDGAAEGQPVDIVRGEALRTRGGLQPKVRSLVVARSGDRTIWLQNARNVQENRELAVELLGASGPAVTGHAGDVTRIYNLTGRRKVRDPRTGLAVTGRAVDAYLDGQIDAFLRRNAPALRRYEEERGG